MPVPRVDLPAGDDDELVRLYLLSPTMGAAAGRFSDAIYNRSSLAPREREVARIRIASINGCEVCLETRMTSEQALSDEEYAGLDDWRSLTTLEPRERLAADFAERFALDHRSMDDEFWSELRAHFSDAELFELAVCVGGWLALGRVTAIFEVSTACPIEL